MVALVFAGMTTCMVNFPPLRAQEQLIVPYIVSRVALTEARSPSSSGWMMIFLYPGAEASGRIPARYSMNQLEMSPNMMWLRDWEPSHSSHRVVAPRSIQLPQLGAVRCVASDHASSP